MRRGEWIGFYFPLIVLAMTLPVIMIVLNPGPFKSLAIFSLVLGFPLFLYSKINVIRRKKLISFGSKYMTRLEKRCYVLGYILIGISGFLAIFSFIGTVAWINN